MSLILFSDICIVLSSNVHHSINPASKFSFYIPDYGVIYLHCFFSSRY